jgi:hypothetical protein
MLNLRTVGFIFLVVIIHKRMKKIPVKGIFISTSRLALAVKTQCEKNMIFQGHLKENLS